MSRQQDSSGLWSQNWPAPAKLNLMLRIVGRRTDGYHLLQTVFQFVDWCDQLRFLPVSDGAVSLVNPLPGVAEADDLTVRAARLLQKETGCQQGVRIAVEKNLPMGGGIGGGSSDAATTLVVLNRLWGLDLSTRKLMELGLVLGADVPIFVHGRSSWAEGVGEKVREIDLPEQWAVIIKPDCEVSTKEIFSSPELTRDSKPITISDFVAGQQNNDCLEVVRQLYPVIKNALEGLSAFTEARLTGTGACVFGLFQSEIQAQKAHDALQSDWKVFLVKTKNESPLRSRLLAYR